MKFARPEVFSHSPTLPIFDALQVYRELRRSLAIWIRSGLADVRGVRALPSRLASPAGSKQIETFLDVQENLCGNMKHSDFRAHCVRFKVSESNFAKKHRFVSLNFSKKV